MCEAAVKQWCVGVQCVLDQQVLVDRVTTALEGGQGRIKAAVLDHIVSFPPVVLPLTELIAACRTVRCFPSSKLLLRKLSQKVSYLSYKAESKVKAGEQNRGIT